MQNTTTHAAVCQGRDDITEGRQGFVDVLGFIEDGSLGTRLAYLSGWISTDVEKQLHFIVITHHNHNDNSYTVKLKPHQWQTISTYQHKRAALINSCTQPRHEGCNLKRRRTDNGRRPGHLNEPPRAYLLWTCQVDQVKLSTELLLGFNVLLLDIDQEDTVTSGRVLIHVCKWNEVDPVNPGELRAVRTNLVVN